MVKGQFITAIVFVLSAGVACGSDDSVGAGGLADGSGGEAGGAGQGGEAGGAGAGQGGAGQGGAGGAPDVAAQPLNPRAVTVIAEPLEGSSPRLLVAATDFVASAEIAMVDLDAGEVSSSASFDDQDTVPAASAGRAFAVERTNDVVHVLDARGEIESSLDLTAEPVDGPTGEKAYVLLFNTNRVAVVDLESAEIRKFIDFGAYLASDDGDGAVDLDAAFYDAEGGRVYVTLGRYDRTTYLSPAGLRCPDVPALLVAIDAETDEVVDLGGDGPDGAVELDLVAPASLAFDAESGRLFLLSSGCELNGTGAGVEAFTFGEGGTEVLLRDPEGQPFLNRIIPISEDFALINGFSEQGEFWARWNPEDDALGDALEDAPMALSHGGTMLYGILSTTLDDETTRFDVVPFDVDDGAGDVIVSDPWDGALPFVAATAFLD
ncbi:MAG TPA: hypothetical protein VF989_17500 [Polyangiaceae bacterium]